MHKLLILISIAVYCEAGGVGGYGGLGGGVILGTGSYGPIPAAIKSIRTVDVKPVALPQDPIVPQVIEVGALDLPVKILFNSRSSPVLVEQVHIAGAPGQVERTSSEEEPHIVRHEVVRPVVQELREVIQPYRRVVQEIQPVLEQVQTIVARGEPRVQAVVAPVAAPVAVPVAAPVAAVGTVGVGAGLVGTGLVGGGLIGNGLVGGGLIGNGLVGGGLIGNGLVSGGLIGNGLVSGGLIGNGLVGNGRLIGLGGIGTGLGNGVLLGGGGLGLSGGKLGTLGTKGGLLLGGYKSSSAKAASS